MQETLQGIWRQTTNGPDRCPKRFYLFNWISFGLIFGALLLILVCELTNARHYENFKGWYLATPFAFYVLAFLGPVLRAARHDRYRGIRVVIFWGLLGLAFFVITFIATYMTYAPVPGNYDRLLNVLPAVIAVWVAGLGWYTHHQIGMKAHRTTHAFNLIMETRSSTEFQKNMRTFQSVYPPGVEMAEADKKLFALDAILQIPALEKIRDDGKLPPVDRDDAILKIKKIEAAISAKYLLNYFEFVARAIESGDLDEEVVYDTIASTVIAIHERTAVLRNHYTKVYPLAGEFSGRLASSWSSRKRQDGAKK